MVVLFTITSCHFLPRRLFFIVLIFAFSIYVTLSNHTMSDIKITSTDIEADKYSVSNLLEMRNRFPGREDEELARFLIARKDDLEKASEQLQKRINFEASFLPVTKDDCGEEFNAGKLYTYGVDKEGRPIIVWAVRNNIAATRDMDKLVKTMVWWVEYTARKVLPPNISKYTILMDRSSFKQENADMDLMKHVAATLQVCSLFFRSLHAWNLLSCCAIIIAASTGYVPRKGETYYHSSR